MSGTKIIITTTLGAIALELDEDKAPKTVDNFLKYVRSGFYDGTIFHRVINDFMIQGGGFDADMIEKIPDAPIENEANNGLANNRGAIAMARTQDPHSATSQFFINVQDNDFLNHSGKSMQEWGYAVFGMVTSGDEVLERIRSAETSNQGAHQDVPKETIIIDSITVVGD